MTNWPIILQSIFFEAPCMYIQLFSLNRYKLRQKHFEKLFSRGSNKQATLLYCYTPFLEITGAVFCFYLSASSSIILRTLRTWCWKGISSTRISNSASSLSIFHSIFQMIHWFISTLRSLVIFWSFMFFFSDFNFVIRVCVYLGMWLGQYVDNADSLRPGFPLWRPGHSWQLGL